MDPKLIAPSILAADFTKLGAELNTVERAGADAIHIDIMDGHFVPNFSMGPDIVKAVRGVTTLPLDVHLMITNPDQYIPYFIKAGADWISVHVEASRHIDRTVRAIKTADLKAGVALNPSTSLSTLDWMLDQVDYVLILGVNTGFGGQQFIPYTLEKIRLLRTIIRGKNLSTLIETDGGINESTIQEIAAAGVNIFVAGSSIFGSQDYEVTIKNFRNIISVAK
ncbi:ribulose-phosphate 3-epimerase [Candidatus Moduliflexus flocculans]|uniref:Ribulose-phosphate 3-epimerase n=1 Tax=Candidatus Moduliflexus flocculans TaxID=1499966 RepID=A0A0S6VSP1_9BACT|nr:ribulose-phosphate 3-epimerase [Candidatus Moduliflexus flocculans]